MKSRTQLERARSSFGRNALFLAAILLLGSSGLPAQTTPVPAAPAQSPASSAKGGIIHGLVKSGNMPLPGVTITATNTLTGQKATTWTDVTGHYVLEVPANGRYVVRAQMDAFAPLTNEVLINDSNRNAQSDLEMVLLSRAPKAAASDELQAQIASALGGGEGGAAAARGFQSLALAQTEGASAQGAGLDQVVPEGMPVPGMSSEAATESVAVSGNTSNPMGSMSSEEFRARIQEFRDQRGGFAGGGRGGGFGGRGGFGGGPGIFVMRGGRGGFNVNRPHGSVYYSAGNSALDAAPYSLTGQPVTKPGYMQNRFGASIGGPLNIPHIYHGGTKTFFFVNYNGSRNASPFDAFSTVPTAVERAGDFSQATITSHDSNGNLVQLPVQIYNPFNGQLIPNANLQNSGLTISPIAQGLLSYIPLPNLPGATQNFHYVTSVDNHSDDLNVRLIHNFGATPSPQRGGGGRGFRFFRGPRNVLTFGLHYHGSSSAETNPFPSVAGNTDVRSFDIPIAYIRSFGKVTNIARVDYNRNRVRTQNLYAFSQNIAGDLGIGGVSQNPFDWGLPNLSFTNFGGVSDISPLLQRNQTLTLADSMIWNHGKHTLRWGGDFRRIELNNETDSNARGSFVFTGLNTAQIGSGGQAAAGTGYDFADFLLGLPQQTSLQFGANNYHFRGNSWDLYAQDNWRLRGNLTLNLGVRYEYVSPFTETNDHIANLILSPGVLNPALGAASVTAVLPSQGYGTTLVRPDRNNFAPRIGLAWKPFSKTVVRAGYGIDYNTAAYQSIAQQLAFQPPFADTQTNVQTAAGDLTLQNGFPPPAAGLITNSYAVDPNYRLGYVQIRNIDIQQEIRPTLILNIDYTGTKGTRLDNVISPNSGLLGLRIADAQAFTWQTSQAYSSANAGSIRLRKRLQGGISIGGTYTFSKSIDDASSIGNGVGISAGGGRGEGGGGGSAAASGSALVAQNPLDLAAERGLSSFDQRHKFTADYLWELPFGHDKRWLSGAGPLRALFGDWEWTGDWTIASGLPFTPRVLGNFADVSRGTYGTLRADVVPGQPVALSSPSVAEWFNVNAFAAPPSGQYGDARRNSIEGPGEVQFDMALTKVIPLKEGQMLEVRASGSNVFNHPHFATIDTAVNSPTFGRVISAGSMRSVELTARYRF
jgi:hypothetical protein